MGVMLRICCVPNETRLMKKNRIEPVEKFLKKFCEPGLQKQQTLIY